MNTPVLMFTLASALALVLMPRRWAPVPLLGGTCYMTLGQGIEFGPFTMTVIRVLVAVGIVRVLLRRESLRGGMNRLDWLMILWCAWTLCSSVFHQEPTSALVYRLGFVYNACGMYFLVRILCQSMDDIVRLSKTIALVLSVVAGAMVYERARLYNPFSVFGGVEEVPALRGGRARASGPFAHPILAGTVGAVCLPLMAGVRRYDWRSASVGILACAVMVVCSASSGPLMTTAVGGLGLAMWCLRRYMRFIGVAVACGLVGLSLAMKAPIYYLVARVGIVDGSTGWYRARLMESAIEHLDEWWLAGTDYTRHWMPAENAVDAMQVDITNHYVRLGVLGGLPMIALFVAMLATALVIVGKVAISDSEPERRDQFVAWTLGCALCAHAVSFMSVSYFDQSVVFLYLTLAVIGSAHAQTRYRRLTGAGKARAVGRRRRARQPGDGRTVAVRIKGSPVAGSARVFMSRVNEMA